MHSEFPDEDIMASFEEKLDKNRVIEAVPESNKH